MKKGLIVAMVVLFTVSAGGIAQAGIEQFADVPAGHWAYDALDKLAADGLVRGFKGGIPRGDLCRYEMALLVAKAMARAGPAGGEDKAVIGKLAAEFAPELDKLGIRVGQFAAAAPAPAVAPAKPGENSKLTIHFEERAFFTANSLGAADGGGYPAGGTVANRAITGNRFRVYLSAPFGDDFNFNARLSQLKLNIQRADSSGALTFDRMYVSDNNAFGGRLDVGRMGTYVGKGGFWGNTGNGDGVAYTANIGAFTLRLGDGQTTTLPLPGLVPEEYRYGELIYNIGKDANLGVAQVRHGPDQRLNILHGKAGIGGGRAVNFEWARNQAADAAYRGKTGWWVGLNSRASAADYPSSNYLELPNLRLLHDHMWGLTYRHFPAGVAGQYNRGSIFSFAPYFQDINGTFLNAVNDVNAFEFDYYYTLKRNLLLGLSYSRVRPLNDDWRDNIFTTTFGWFF